jgi:hypothetical protein
LAKGSAAKDDSVRLDAEHSLVGASGSTLAKMSTAWTLRQVGSVRQIDFRMRLKADKPLRFADTDDGGFAFRLREEFREDRGATLRNAAGSTGAKAIWGKPSPWTDYSTKIGEKTYGVAILSHPSNPRHPSGWHARNYGLNSANPFAESSFLEEKGGSFLDPNPTGFGIGSNRGCSVSALRQPAGRAGSWRSSGV